MFEPKCLFSFHVFEFKIFFLFICVRITTHDNNSEQHDQFDRFQRSQTNVLVYIIHISNFLF